MARRSTVMHAPGRPPPLAVLGMLALVFVVWAAAAPRGGYAARWLGGAGDATTTWDSFIFRYGCAWGCLSPGEGSDSATSDAVGAAIGWTFLAVLALVATTCLALALRVLLTHLTEREDRGVRADDAVALDLEALSLALATGTGHRLDALSAGTPAEGIIAAWSHLEATVHDFGMPLPLSRTSTEVSLEVLRRFSVDPATLDTLGGLYREARWSRHPLTEGDRGRAASAYRRLEAALRQQMRGADR